ncbi:hypothetical protein BMS3Abin14_02142 [bacterium BMS3Abin14]|nr:hypothetical protein BMS3Abin14_02142 [bacterium BMS3Abin14]
MNLDSLQAMYYTSTADGNLRPVNTCSLPWEGVSGAENEAFQLFMLTN